MFRFPYVLITNLLRLLKFSLVYVLYRLFSLFSASTSYVQIRIPNSIPIGLTKRMRWFSEGTSLLDLRKDFLKISKDPKIKGIVLEFETMGLSSFLAAELIHEIKKLQKQGKEVIARSDSFTLKTLMVASLCDSVLLTPSGRIYPFGARIESTFLRGIFEKVGITAQFIHIGEFKAAANRYLRHDMSPSQKSMMQSLLDCMEDQNFQTLSEQRKLDRKELAAALSGGPIDARRAKVLKLIDGEAFESDLIEWLELREETSQLRVKDAEKKKKNPITIVPLDEYGGVPKLRLMPFRRPKYIALLDLSGVIVGPGMPARGKTVNSEKVIPILKSLADDSKVASVILHINSPGGSALASDIMWNEIEKLRSRKPVVALCSDVAASGGYYLAVGADKIVCRKETITGSIGVITGKFSGGELAERIGLDIDVVTNSESSVFMSMYAPLPNHLLQSFRDEARSFYRRFLERVGMARDISRRRLHRYGRGRVYMGDQAKERSLIDRLDGLDGAIDEARKLVGEKSKNLKIRFFSTEKVTLKSMIANSSFTSLQLLSKVEENLDYLELLQSSKTLALMPLSIKEK